MKKSALLMVEFQQEWLDPNGKLYGRFKDAKLREHAVRHAKQAQDHAHRIGMPVIYTAMGFSDDYRELGQTDFGLRGAIPRAKTWQNGGESLHPDFMQQPQDYVVANKKGASAFAHTDLDLYLRTHQVQHLYLAGFALHVCILATAWAAHDLGYEVTLLPEASAAFTQAQQHFVVQELWHHIGKHQTLAQFIQVNQQEV